jgi:hypothetical protein
VTKIAGVHFVNMVRRIVIEVSRRLSEETEPSTPLFYLFVIPETRVDKNSRLVLLLIRTGGKTNHSL